MRWHTIFSEREKEVISLLLEGKSNKQIAQVLHISISTVEFHLRNIYSKLNVSSRSEALIKLFDDQLQKPTGRPEKHKLRQAIVESGNQPLENEKNFDLTWRFLMKKIFSRKTGLITILVIVVVASVFLFLVKPSGNQIAEQTLLAQMAQIREILGNPDLQLTFQGIQGLANAPWIEAAVYADEMGATYWVAIDAGCLASINPAQTSRVDVPAVDVKNIDDVRPIAEKFASALSLRFDELKNELRYEEGSKGDLYFFRWDYGNKDWSGTSWEKMPPFLQIGMSADGKLATYINTLDLY